MKLVTIVHRGYKPTNITGGRFGCPKSTKMKSFVARDGPDLEDGKIFRSQPIVVVENWYKTWQPISRENTNFPL